MLPWSYLSYLLSSECAALNNLWLCFFGQILICLCGCVWFLLVTVWELKKVAIGSTRFSQYSFWNLQVSLGGFSKTGNTTTRTTTQTGRLLFLKLWRFRNFMQSPDHGLPVTIHIPASVCTVRSMVLVMELRSPSWTNSKQSLCPDRLNSRCSKKY